MQACKHSARHALLQKEPTNLETPFDQVDAYLTPTELFYIRSHFPAPTLELASYRLRIDGAVQNPVALRYEQLRDMPSETRVAMLECAGNSRVFLIPQVAGAQWELGAVGNAEWTGVPLGTLLERAGLEDDACEIVLEGADRGAPPPASSARHARVSSRRSKPACSRWTSCSLRNWISGDNFGAPPNPHRPACWPAHGGSGR